MDLFFPLLQNTSSLFLPLLSFLQTPFRQRAKLFNTGQMSNGRPFHLSSFLPGSDDPSHSTNNNPQPQPHHRGDSTNRADSSDEEEAVEVFYDHDAELMGHEITGQATRHHTHQNSNEDVKAVVAGAPRRGTEASTTAAAMEMSLVLQQQQTRTSNRSKRATVRQYNCLVNSAVATMDSAVRVPSALRGAARRTMYDVLVDVQRGTRSEEESSTRVLPVSATAQPSALPPPQQLQKQVPVASAASSTRERTHQMLFPSSIPAQLKKQRGSGGSEGDPIVVHSGGTTTSINTSVASPSSHNLPSTSSNANDSSSQRAALKTPAASSRVEAKTTAASPSAEVVRPPRRSTGGEKQTLSASAASLGAGSGPDRRLRHLLPMHLRGAFPDDTQNDHPDDSSRCQDRQRAAQHDAHDSVSDISTSSASSDDERGGGKQTVRRATTRTGVPEKDACLLGVLEGGGGRVGGTEPLKDDSLSPHILLNMKKGTEQESSAAGEVGWLRRLEEEEYAALQRRQGKSAADSLRGATTGAESSLLEGVLLGIAAHRTSASDRQRASHQKSQRASRSPSSGNTRGSADTGSMRSSSSSSSSSATSAIASADSLDLMRDVDDDVPRWVRRNEARQHPQCHVPFAAGQQPPPADKTSVHLEREYADAVRPFIGKPAAFYPSCAAARRPLREGNATVPSFFAAAAGSAAINSSGGAPSHMHRLNAGRPYSNNSAVGTGRGGFFAFATRVTTAAFFNTWKEGRRLLKQNPTALAVVKYLCERFERWRPFDASLRGDADAACDAGDSSRRCVGSQVKASSEKGDEEEKASARHHPTSPVVAHLGDTSNESGVEVKSCVRYVEAAFNVAVVRGTVVWCSEKAHARLGTEERKPADSPLHEQQQQQQQQPQCLSNLSCVGFPSAGGAGDGEEVAWSFLFPEPALMQVTVTVGEHLYLAEPYFVYPAQRLVVASYNFTTDAVVRQQRQQFELEAEERLRVVARTANGGRDAVGDVDALDTRTGQGVRHRGVSPARTAAHALLSASQAARSPTDLHQTTSATDRSPHQRVYEIPGGTRTPLRTPLGPALATPDRPRSTPQAYGASPEPLPPSQQLQQGVEQAAKALFTEGHRSIGDAGHAADRTDMRITLSQTAAMARAGADIAHNATRSVTSFAADGFYDPLAMPAFATTNQTSGGGDGAAAAAAASRFDGGVTMVLTGNSADEEGQPSGMWTGTPAALHDSDGGGVGFGGLRAPPPMQHLAGSPASHATYPQGTSDTGSALGVDVRGDGANAAAVERGTTMRTFGSAEAAVADKMGEGFPRGPPADWDVPLEVIYALSGVVSSRASRSLQLLPPEKSAHTRGGEDRRLNHSSQQQQQLLGESAVAASSQQRKRARRSVSIESLSPPQPPTTATSAQISDVQQHQMHNDLTQEVSYSFPTPAVSHAALSPLPHSPDADDASLSFSISSPSDDDSDVDITKATTISTEARKDSVLHHRPAARAVPTRGRRGGGIQQQQQQQRQDEWMRRLWQQEPADALSAVAMPANKSGPTTGRAPQEPMRRVTSTPQRNSSGGGEGEGVRMSSAASMSGTTSQQNASEHASATTTTSLSPRASNIEVMVAPPPLVEDDTASNTMTGLYALNDVILSDSDD